jgi:hypothetical protein
MLKNYNYAHCKSTKGKKPQSNHHGDATRLFWLVVKTKIMTLRKHTHTQTHMVLKIQCTPVERNETYGMYTHSNDIENFTLSETTVFMVEGQGTFNIP